MKFRFTSIWRAFFSKKSLFRIGLFLCIGYFVFGIYFYFCDQDEWLTDPNAIPTGHVEITFESVDNLFKVDAIDSSEPFEIHYRKYSALSKSFKGTVFYLHGNKGNMDLCEWEIELFLRRGYDVWTMDYREFGESTGTLSAIALRQDAKNVYDKITSSGIEENKIVVWGRSFGSGVAASLIEADSKPGLLVLETPYWSLPDAARYQNLYLPDFLFHYKFPIHQYLTKAECQIELIHGTQDEKIPFSSSERLYLRCHDQLKLTVGRHAIMCAPHNLRPDPEFEVVVNKILK